MKIECKVAKVTASNENEQEWTEKGKNDDESLVEQSKGNSKNVSVSKSKRRVYCTEARKRKRKR